MTAVCPAWRSAFAVWLPMYPAPPVTRTVVGLLAADGVIGESILLHLLRSEEIPAIEDDRRTHQRAHAAEVGSPELVPFRDDGEAVRSLERVIVLGGERHARAEDGAGDLRCLWIVRLDGG